MSEAVYLGFDLSTQQLKALAISADLKLVTQTTFDFDADSKGYHVTKGVQTNESEGEVFAPVAMWLQAIDTVLRRLKANGLDFTTVAGVCGAGMQHGSIFWNHDAERLLAHLNPAKSLEQQLGNAFASPHSPNWQDASTQHECDEFDAYLGSPEQLAQTTGSKAHHRFTGPQILRFTRKHSDRYRDTARINLVSSFLATIFLGKFADFDISDVCGMNLWDMTTNKWHDGLLTLASGQFGLDSLRQKLGNVAHDGGASLGNISQYFVHKYNFPAACQVIASNGDNPSTILALPLQPNDAIVSLGTSSTFLMSTSEFKADPAVHFFNHPTTKGLYMFMLCYKNGGLAREQIRDEINKADPKVDSHSWKGFDDAVLSTSPLVQASQSGPMNLGIYFPRPEIVPNLPALEAHYTYSSTNSSISRVDSTPNPRQADARVIVESQFLSMRLRAQNVVRSPGNDTPPQPRRLYLVGGGSKNAAIAKVAGEVLGGSEGVYKLDLGENACALGAAYKAVWAVERGQGESFEELIGKRWREEDFIEKIANGYSQERYRLYGEATKGFAMMEEALLEQAGRARM